LKVWLLTISPMVWRRVVMPAEYSLRELHGVIQVAMGWEGIHLYQFRLRAARYGSCELSASSPDVTIESLRLRNGARFTYEYDLNVCWRHEIRIEDRLELDPRKTYPVFLDRHGACPPEDCGGAAGYLERRAAALSLAAFDGLNTIVDIVEQVVIERRSELLDAQTRWRLEWALDRTTARHRWQGQPFSRRAVNARFRRGEHRQLMYQQW
jgi:Plasmid pRiA4b ORF-3-like protein